MHLVLPVAGLSERFHGMMPKFLKKHPSGYTMLVAGIAGLMEYYWQSILIVYRTDGMAPDVFMPNWRKTIAEQIQMITSCPVHFSGIDGTRNQPETVYRGLARYEDLKNEAFLVKDCDNYYALDTAPSGNMICYASLENYPNVTAADKSYVHVLQGGKVDNIVEKKVLGSHFCVGGYGFRSFDMFERAYQSIPTEMNDDKLYISHLIYHMMRAHDEVFMGHEVQAYQDWGTQIEWDRLFQ